jgi:hypothetical protein
MKAKPMQLDFLRGLLLLALLFMMTTDTSRADTDTEIEVAGPSGVLRGTLVSVIAQFIQAHAPEPQ